MSIVQKVRHVINQRKQNILFKYTDVFRRISTAQKAPEVGGTTAKAEAQQLQPKKKVRNWQSYGFDFVDERRDYFYMHTLSFCAICGTLWGSYFIMSYYPDLGELAWASREARIQIRRREVLGLPMVDPNYIDPALVNLPPDEELDQEDIII